MLTEKDCKVILQNYLKRKDVNFKKFELHPISANSEGFLGEHHKLLITHEVGNQTKTVQLFIKTAPFKNPAQQEIVEGFAVYAKEIFCYEVLFNEFRKYGYDTSFAATSYYSIKDQALVMEDMTLKGFNITDRHVHFSFEHLKCALDALALYHAAGFAYDQLKTKEKGIVFRLGDVHNEYLKENCFVHYTNPDGYGMNFWRGMDKTFLTIVSLIDEEIFPGLKEMYQDFKFGKVFADDSKISKTCGHGDLWSNNLMFRYENDIPVKCCLIDFQVIRYFYPCLDILFVIFGNTKAEFRTKHLKESYSYYFDKLGEALLKYGYKVDKIHPWKDFLQTIKMVLPDALTQVLLAKSIVGLPKDKVSEIVNNDASELRELFFDNSKIAEITFKTDENYRNDIMETMKDMYDALTDLQE